MSPNLARIAAGAASVVTVGALVVGCAASPAATPEPTETGPVTIEFWSWAAGMDVLVDEFNKTHDNITVQLGELSPSDAYQKITSAVEAGNAPDLAQVEYQQIPTFATNDILEDVSNLSKAYQDNYLDWAWAGTGFLDQHYGIPNDVGPMVMYYNTDLYSRAGITPPKTWEEFATSAQTMKDTTGAVMATGLVNGGFWAGLSWQAAAEWFGISGDAWEVGVADDPTQSVFTRWADLASAGLVNTDPGFNPGFWQALDSEQVASYIVGAWGYRGLKGNLKNTAGEWAVAPLPADKGEGLGNMGGSTWSVVKGSQHAAAALEFANWLASDPVAMNLQWENSGYFPAAADSSTIEKLNAPDEFFGGQALGPVLAEAAGSVDTDWQWGPNMTTLYSQITDNIAKLMVPDEVESTLVSIEDATIEDLKAAGLSVK